MHPNPRPATKMASTANLQLTHPKTLVMPKSLHNRLACLAAAVCNPSIASHRSSSRWRTTICNNSSNTSADNIPCRRKLECHTNNSHLHKGRDSSEDAVVDCDVRGSTEHTETTFGFDTPHILIQPNCCLRYLHGGD